MTVEELITQLQEGCASGKWKPDTRVTYMDYRWSEGPCNLVTLEVQPVLEAADDDASIIFPIYASDPQSVEFVAAVAEDCNEKLEDLTRRTELCLLLRPERPERG